jgi:hypothetical protein
MPWLSWSLRASTGSCSFPISTTSLGMFASNAFSGPRVKKRKRRGIALAEGVQELRDQNERKVEFPHLGEHAWHHGSAVGLGLLRTLTQCGLLHLLTAEYGPNPSFSSAILYARGERRSGRDRFRVPRPSQLRSRILNFSPPLGVSVTVALMPGGSLPTYSGRKRRKRIDSASVFSTWLMAPPMHERLPAPNGR